MDWSKGNVVLLLLLLYAGDNHVMKPLWCEFLAKTIASLFEGLSYQTEWKQLITGCYM